MVEPPPGWLQSAGRIIERLDALFEIGRDAGTNRPGLGEGEQRAHDLVAGWMHEAGLAVTVDRAGNLWGRAAGADPSLSEVWSGSHLDTPPDGGRFDGALGVVTALEAAAAIKASGGARRTIAVVAFRLEEGPRFGRGVFGSRALFGELEADEADLVDADGVTLGEAFTALGLGQSLPSEAILERAPACFVEAHIEQGPSLAAQGATLGVVTSIAGMAGIEIVFAGRRGHAGTVPMDLRSDALGAAAGFVRRVHDAARSLSGAVATVGRLDVSPGATNTIPGRVELFADLRAPDSERLDALVAAASSAARHAADGASCQVEVLPRWRYEPVAMDPEPLGRAAAGHRRRRSRAGRAALGRRARRGDHGGGGRARRGCSSYEATPEGVSHAPEEATGADAVAAAVGVLEAALRELAA